MPNLQSAFISRAAFALLAVLALSACTSTEDGDQLPTYAQREADGAVRVDLETASNGSAKWNGEDRIELNSEDGQMRFVLVAVSYASGIGVSLEDPPLRISPVLSPGDGVSDISAAVWIEGDPAELHVEVFIDTDWRDGVGEDVFIHSQELADGERRDRRISIDFSESIQGVYRREMVFVGDPYLFITNMDGETYDVVRAIQKADIEEGDVAVSFVGRPR